MSREIFDESHLKSLSLFDIPQSISKEILALDTPGSFLYIFMTVSPNIMQWLHFLVNNIEMRS